MFSTRVQMRGIHKAAAVNVTVGCTVTKLLASIGVGNA